MSSAFIRLEKATGYNSPAESEGVVKLREHLQLILNSFFLTSLLPELTLLQLRIYSISLQISKQKI